ncbi:hypothetical protein [Microtetraspora malaysiensis]|uniref:hypothetical protein n=1 Tax=Microtetraspora malaysiensis TaxID=161358 RepID=UPI003D922BF3
MAQGKRFVTAAATAPNADDTIPDVKTSRRKAVKTSVESEPTRTAFTWRLTPDQVIEHDELILQLRRELGRAKLDKATVLDTLIKLAAENRAVYGALVARLQDV